MIIKAPVYRSSLPKLNIRPMWFGVGFAVIMLGILVSYIPRHQAMGEGVYCSAEEIVFKGTSPMFQGEGAIFDNAKSQSDEFARTGEYSSKTDGANKYGMLYQLMGAKVAERYKVEVWRHGNKLAQSFLVVSMADANGDGFYLQEGRAVEVDEDEWERLEISFAIPPDYEGQAIKIYVFGGDTPVYFDDMRIERLREGKETYLSVADSNLNQVLHMKLDDKAMRKLEQRRRRALNTGIYFAEEDDWVKTKLSVPGDEIPAKLRFKGDWMDHLAHEKRSFRIRVKAPHAWRRMLTFSIQRPENRYFLSEWVYHKMLAKEDVLTTRYDFVQVKINEQAKGVYAFEEHFEKQLPEFNARREGPIVKFSEDGVWNARKRWLDYEIGAGEIEEVLNSYEASLVEPFRSSKTLETPTLNMQFQVAKQLMEQYKFGQAKTSEVFDLEKLAKFQAITDICQAFHSTVWHNQRFYYNPVIGKLEPIGYDGFTEEGIYNLPGGKTFIGASIQQLSGDFGDDLLRQHMLDTAFVSKYMHYLNAFSQKSYMDEFWLDIESALNTRLAMLKEEYPGYAYSKKILTDQSEKIQRLIHPLEDNSIRAFRSQNGKLQLSNYHILPLKLIGFGNSSSRIDAKLEAPKWLLPNQADQLPRYQEIEPATNGAYIFFQLPGSVRLYSSRIVNWSARAPLMPMQEIWAKADINQHDFWHIDGKVLNIKPGNHRITKDVVIPAGYELFIPAGTQLDLVEDVKFLSQSPVNILGTEELPVRIFSSDKSAKGFTVIKASKPSRMEHVSFEDLGTLDVPSWQLTGAVTFYESEVHIRKALFTRNHSEDALNLIRSYFSLYSSVISHTYSDGLDVDFGEGEIKGLRCIKTGNDAIDFSGSKVQIWDFEAESPGDKGISVGEESSMIIHDAVIKGAKVGLASKDLSKVEVRNIVVRNCNIAFSAYQKKPEFGGASIEVKNYEATDIKHLHMIERGSILKIKGKAAESI